jgi:D-alanyl-lipoteichoic acid acyltransferase DltB (MBOAT superfamily)
MAVVHRPGVRRPAVWALTFTILAGFIVLKSPGLDRSASALLRTLSGQPAGLATAGEIRWLGYSYLAFRLLHVLRDAATGRLPQVGLRDFVTYALFVPALAAGPIDRLERFTGDLDVPKSDPENTFQSVRRLAIGLFKKFALADTLALIALNPANATQADGPWLWLLLYAYALRIYFDFSGYTDIAIGLGLAVGVRLPENFNAPYLKHNLAAFWNAWHITLADWFRSYFFIPVVRGLRRGRVSAPVVVLAGQVGTMALIGIWHGVSWNFLVWGLWHGLGLFIQNRWSAAVRGRFDAWEPAGWVKPLLRGLGTLATFHFVALGWCWFVMDSPAAAWDVWTRLWIVAAGIVR